MKMRVTYAFEDHSYPTQTRAKAVLPDYVCSPGKHKWRTHAEGSISMEVCDDCGLLRLTRP